MRAYVIVVNCLTDAAQNFYAKYGFEVLCEHNRRVRMFMPMKTVEMLFTQDQQPNSTCPHLCIIGL